MAMTGSSCPRSKQAQPHQCMTTPDVDTGTDKKKKTKEEEDDEELHPFIRGLT